MEDNDKKSKIIDFKTATENLNREDQSNKNNDKNNSTEQKDSKQKRNDTNKKIKKEKIDKTNKKNINIEPEIDISLSTSKNTQNNEFKNSRDKERNKIINNIRNEKNAKESNQEVNIALFDDRDKSRNKKKILDSFDNRLFFNILIYVFTFILFLTITINLPIFKVNEIQVSGLKNLTKEEVLNSFNYNKSKNFFFLYFGKIDNKIRKLHKIKDVDVRFTFPNEVAIRVDEIRLAGYIKYYSDNVYLDSEGKIVDVTPTVIDNIPSIQGLEFSNFALGKKLEVKNDDSLGILIELTNILNKYNVTDRFSLIDITDTNDIRLDVGNIEVILGENQNSDFKIRKSIEILKLLPENSKGYLDVSSNTERATFMPVE